VASTSDSFTASAGFFPRFFAGVFGSGSAFSVTVALRFFAVDFFSSSFASSSSTATSSFSSSSSLVFFFEVDFFGLGFGPASSTNR
jgi:uncharacterized membrane protein YfcA